MLFVYLIYTFGGKAGHFQLQFPLVRAKELLAVKRSFPVNEYNEACTEFVRCIGKDVHESQFFADSKMAPELMAGVLLCASSKSEQLVSQAEALTSTSIHIMYVMENTAKGLAVAEVAFPGPAEFAPENAIQDIRIKYRPQA